MAFIGIAERAIAEGPGDVQVLVPSVNITVTAVQTPLIDVGQIFVPAATFLFEAFPPLSEAGVTVDVPPVVVVIVAPEPRVAIPYWSRPPSIGLTVTALVPSVASGARVVVQNDIPSWGGTIAEGAVAEFGPTDGSQSTSPAKRPPDIGVQAFAPSVRSGISVQVPGLAIVVDALLPHVAVSARIIVPSVDIVVAAHAPRIAHGATIHVSNLIPMTLHSGAVAEGAVAEFAITEGPASVADTVVPPRVIVATPPPEIRTGVRLAMPVTNIAIAALALEVGARRRAVQMQIISS